ncbi:hypothetical protein AJ80_04218 [Polytolypa hystricis UAMH7299]|uniref:Leo1-like protein n=1 Tax=Polytolypa hystricis (strain UAMH7299) TaxID=1447883 RepID=A0A2B7YD71_POLH7|nr:hypothetical protein AJ80_04218 [Polytolypa hystricis UAMH7299]
MSSDEEPQGPRSRQNGLKYASDASDASDVDKQSNASGLEDELNGDDNDADLFGSGSEADNEPPRRRLDDEELDSGDDADRFDRRGSPMEEDGPDYDRETLNIMDLSLARAPGPESTDGDIYTLNIPNFLTIESEDFNPETYVAPPFSSASTSLCWRYDPIKGKDLQSNARIVRWSDGSLTLQLASNPKEHYKMPSKRLARSKNTRKTEDYDSELDSHVYLGAAAEASSVIRITSHLTSSLTILPSAVETDDAVQRLQESLAAAARGSRKNADGTVTVFEIKEDPELAKKQAELAEREKLREARKRQIAAERDLDRGRKLGYSRAGGAGLTVAGLEGDGEMLTTKARGARKPKRRSNRYGEIYSDDEDEYDRRGRTREDEYDEDDGFLVGSDEEPEIVEDEDEEEEFDEDADAEGEIDEDARPSPRQQQKLGSRERDPATPKRGREDNASPVRSENPEAQASPHARKKNRYIVDDDEDE